MNSKYLSLSKTKKYIQKKYLQFKEIRNPKRQTIYFVYYGTVGCFSIGIIADLCIYLIRKDLLLALCNILSLGLFLLFTYLLIRKKKQITFFVEMHLLYHTKQYPNIDVLPYLPPTGRDRLLFVARSDDRYGYLWSGFHLCESTHRNDIIFRPDSFVYVHRGLYIIRTLFDESAQPGSGIYLSSHHVGKITGNTTNHATTKGKNDIRAKTMGCFQCFAPATE